MVANMALSVKQPQHAPSREGAPDPHQYAWLVKADSSHALIPSPDKSSNSWEARAFAEDASSLASGIWPPRAYPCSFCRREFRSAQALGGHMNVHRRDRARLRHSSPPPPFRPTHNIPLQPSTIIHKSQHEYSSSTSINPDIYPSESLSKFNYVLPTVLPLSAVSPYESSTASLAARYPSDMAASFPLRLHLLASEAASTLMLPQGESSDLLSLWPASALGSRTGCHAGIQGSTIDISSWSRSSNSSSSSASIVLSCPVSPSMGAATPCRRARHSAPIIQLDDESPKKKSNVTNNSDFQPYQVIKLENSSKDDEISHAHDKQILDLFDKVDDQSIRIQRGREACSELVDLELRLGQRPP